MLEVSSAYQLVWGPDLFQDARLAISLVGRSSSPCWFLARLPLTQQGTLALESSFPLGQLPMATLHDKCHWMLFPKVLFPGP